MVVVYFIAQGKHGAQMHNFYVYFANIFSQKVRVV